MTKLLFDPNSLVESTVRDKTAEAIIPKEYNLLVGKFSELKGYWSKAAFVYFLSKGKPSFKAAGRKMQLDMQLYDSDIYKRYISIFYSDIKKNDFLKDAEYFSDKIVNAYMDYGKDEIVTLCNMTSVVGRSYTQEVLKKVSITQEVMKELL